MSDEKTILIVERFQSFFKRYCWTDIIELANSYPEKRSLLVKFQDIDIYDSKIADMLLNDPDVILESATRALREMDIPTGVILDEANLRVVKLPRKVKIRDIRSNHIGRFVSIEGLVTKATEVRPRIIEAAFECPFCHHIFSTPQAGSQFKEPYECPQEDGGCGRKVQRFLLRVDQSEFVNAQKIRLQESPEELRGGELPQALDVNLEDDISGEVAPGDRIVVAGILRSYQRVTQFGKKLFFDIYLDGNSLELTHEVFDELNITDADIAVIIRKSQEPDIYEQFCKSIAPSVYGYDKIKGAIVHQLFGGVPKGSVNGLSKIRGDIHILIVGDPGIAKSVILLYVVGLAPRGVYGSAKTASGPGLTAAAVQDPKEGWTLEAGTLVMADRGFAALDELDKMKKDDRDTMHEALEQQTVTIAKAGIQARLNARCSCLAAANPTQGRFDLYEPLSKQINMPPTLLSRFDLIFTMPDKPEKRLDRETALFIIKNNFAGEILACEENKETLSEEAERFKAISFEELDSPISQDLFRKYVAYSRRTVHPVMSREAMQKFEEFYIGLRKLAYDATEASPIPVTARELEALIRLGEAHARIRLAKIVTSEDADAVIKLVDYCLKTVFIDPETGKLDADWVTVGTTKTQRDRVRSIREIIKALGKAYGEEVPLSVILDQAVEEGMERDKAEDIIEVMKRDGILYSPGGGVVKFVE